MKRLPAMSLLGAALLPGAGGCVNSNARTSIGDAPPLPIFTPEGNTLSQSPPASSSGPSLAGMDRSNWAPAALVVPVDAPGYRPIYIDQRPEFRVTARQRREFPTPRAALELQGVSHGQQLKEAGKSAVFALEDLVLLPVRAVEHAPWAGPEHGKPLPYWRAPVTEPRTPPPAANGL